MTRTPREFFARDTIDVARDLLGCTLVRRLSDGRELRARIVETEAYLGVEDPSCHSFNHRRTPRTETMFGEPGLAYVYLIYGMHHCLNVVTVSRDVAEAVLIRAAEPTAGFADGDPKKLSGPGRLCRALDLTRAHDGIDLTRDPALYLMPGPPPDAVVSGPRVGLGGTDDAIHWPLRFGVFGSPALSKPRFTDSP